MRAIRAGAREGYARGIICASLLVSCAAPADSTHADVLVVHAAASLARPIAAALDSFTSGTGLRTRMVIGGSIDLARRITDLAETPDVVVLADEEILRRLLLGEHLGSYVRFATNRLVLAYSGHSTRLGGVDSLSWALALARNGVEVARADPARAPVGYRTILAWRLAERRLASPGLAARLMAQAPDRNVRASEAEVLALVASGSADFGWAYESSARAAGLRVVPLPGWMDFGDPGMREWYASESIAVAARRPGDTIMLAGEPITYVLGVPRRAPHRANAQRLAAFLCGDGGRRVLKRAGLDVLPSPQVVSQ